jgi:hypothetical protein
MNIVLIIPADLKDKANALGAAMGWGPESYSVPLSPDGADPATYHGLNLAEAGDAFLAMLAAAGNGEMPQELIDGGYPPQDFAAVMAGLIVRAGVPFDTALGDAGLARIAA